MLFTVMIAYFRHKLGFTANNMVNALIIDENKHQLLNDLKIIFEGHSFTTEDDKEMIVQKIKERIIDWTLKIESSPPKGLFYEGGNHDTKKSLLVNLNKVNNSNELRKTMQSMRSVEPQAFIKLKKN